MTKFKIFIPSSESERSDYFYALYLNFNFYNDRGGDKWYYQVIPDCNDDANFPLVVHDGYGFSTKQDAYDSANKWLHDRLNELVEK